MRKPLYDWRRRVSDVERLPPDRASMPIVIVQTHIASVRLWLGANLVLVAFAIVRAILESVLLREAYIVPEILLRGFVCFENYIVRVLPHKTLPASPLTGGSVVFLTPSPTPAFLHDSRRALPPAEQCGSVLHAAADGVHLGLNIPLARYRASLTRFADHHWSHRVDRRLGPRRASWEPRAFRGSLCELHAEWCRSKGWHSPTTCLS